MESKIAQFIKITYSCFYSGSATQSIADFEFRWRHWQTEVRARIDEGDFAADPRLSVIAGVLSGSESAYIVSFS